MNNIATIPITRNYSVRVSDSTRERNLRTLESEGFIKTQLRESVECNKCGTTIPSKLGETEKHVTCWNCHKLVSRKLVSERFIDSVQYDAIIARVESLLVQAGISYRYDKVKR